MRAGPAVGDSAWIPASEEVRGSRLDRQRPRDARNGIVRGPRLPTL